MCPFLYMRRSKLNFNVCKHLMSLPQLRSPHPGVLAWWQCPKRLPFGISSAPEYFQRWMSAILAGHKGVLCHMDDIFIFGRDQGEHDAHLAATLRPIQAAGVTLNADKCLFSQTSISFLGQIIDHNGVLADPGKTAAVLQITTSSNNTELCRFLGMVNKVGKFSPNLAKISRPLCELLGKHCCWTWGSTLEALFQHIKEELAKPSILVLYDTIAQRSLQMPQHTGWE